MNEILKKSTSCVANQYNYSDFKNVKSFRYTKMNPTTKVPKFVVKKKNIFL